MAKHLKRATIVIACTSTVVFAQATPPTYSAIDAIYGTCFNPEYRSIDHIGFAEFAEWPELEPAVLDALRPANKPDPWTGWIATTPDDNQLAFFSFAGKTNDVEICGAFFRKIRGPDVWETMQDETRIEILDTATELGWTSHMFSVEQLPNAQMEIRWPRDEADTMIFVLHKQ